MYKLIIADDEEVERRALNLKIKKNLPDIEVCALAEDGQELVEAVRRYHPDIIIVDIEMPVLTGLEAVQVIRDQKLMEDGKILIYTAYGQFTYAQKALKARVDDYILKPVTIQKLIEVMRDCIARLDMEREEKKRNSKTEEILGQVRSKVEEEFMAALSVPDIDEDQGHIFRYILGDKDVHGFVMALQIKPAKACPEVQKQSFMLQEAVKKLKHVLKEYNGIPGERTYQEICCFIPLVQGRLFSDRFEAVRIAKEIADKMERDGKVRIRAGIGNVGESHTELHRSYGESFIALHDKSRKDAIVHIQELRGTLGKGSPFSLDLETVIKKIRDRDPEGCEEIVCRSFFFARNYEFARLQEEVLEMSVRIISRVEEWLKPEKRNRYSAQNICCRIQDAKNREELRDWFIKMLYGLIKDVGEYCDESPNYWVRCAVDYIRDNYWKDISLSVVAEDIGVTSYYLSRIFVEVIGENYSVFLSSYRVEKACELLKKYNYSTAELAEKVGFNSAGYFNKVFKKKMGCTVSEYKGK